MRLGSSSVAGAVPGRTAWEQFLGAGDRDSLAQLVEKPLSDQEVISLVHLSNFHRARGVVVSHPLGMREALGSIPSVSRHIW